MKSSYEMVMEFKHKFPGTVSWFRLKKHCEILDKHINPNEKLLYVLCGQLDNNHMSFFNTGLVAVTSERLLVVQNRLFIGYRFTSVTPDMYNDLSVDSGLIWGMLTIDTIKEQIYVSNLSKKCLPEVETTITMCMQECKKKYRPRDDQKKD